MDPKFLEHVNRWMKRNHRVAKRIWRLVRATLRDPFNGLGAPEPLKGNRSGQWSREIKDEHRMIYTVEANSVHFLEAEGHYR